MTRGLVLPWGRAGATSVLVACCAAAGCPGPDTSRVTRIAELTEETESQARLIQQKDDQLREQAGRIESLMTLSGDRRLEPLAKIARIEFASLTGGYDDNRDGIDDGVVVYLQPIDEDGDVVKAHGEVSVRLLDLANPPESQQVGALRLDARALRAEWYGRLTSHYTLKVPWADGVERAPHKKITVLVSFAEFLTGRVFGEQIAVDIGGAAE